MTCGERIQELRKKKNLSPERLAKEVGVSVDTLNSWESGTSLPEPAKLLVLAAVLNTDAGYLEHGTTRKAANPAESARKLSSIFYTAAMILYFIGFGTGEFSKHITVLNMGVPLLYYGTSPLALCLLAGTVGCIVMGIVCSIQARKRR